MPSKKNSNSKSASGKKAPAKKVTKQVAPPAPEPEVQVAAPVVAETQELSLDKYTSQFTSLISELQQWRSNITNMIANVRSLQRSVEKEMRNSSKKSKKQLNKPKREPSGFAKPSLLSDELCKFVGKPKGSLMARTEVTKFITGYIKDHNLQDTEFKRRILPDNKLNKLLKVPKSQELTYFNLQTYMKTHFPKPAVESTS